MLAERINLNLKAKLRPIGVGRNTPTRNFAYQFNYKFYNILEKNVFMLRQKFKKMFDNIASESTLYF